MLAQVKKDLGTIRSRSMLNIAGMTGSFLAFGAILLFFNFSSPTIVPGVSIILLTIAIYTLLLYREHRLISGNDYTVYPDKFLARLHQYQLSRFQLYTRLYWFYTGAISIGLVLCFAGTLEKLELWIQAAFIIFTCLWILFCATVLRRSFMRKEKERIGLLVEKFERLNSQFREQA